MTDTAFQSFEETARPENGPPRLAELREVMAAENVDAFLIPRADAHQGEYVAARDARLAWLTGFTGSAGTAVALASTAAIFTDSRYTVQVRGQVDPVFTPILWPETQIGDWLARHLKDGATLAFDPWLHPVEQIEKLRERLSGVTFRATDNLVDRIWPDQPTSPMGKVTAHPETLAGRSAAEKIADLAGGLSPAKAFVLTLPDSIAWLLNIRGSDIPHNPVAHGFALLQSDGQVRLFMDAAKLADMRDHLPGCVSIAAPDTLLETLGQLTGPVALDPSSCPLAIHDALSAAGIEILRRDDPCILPKAQKTEAELNGARDAHLRDALAMVRFLSWLDATAPGDLTEIDVVKRLEAERRQSNQLRDISFETISGSGPNGAIVHYRVTQSTNRKLREGELLLVDSGGQYTDGTTDITRTVPIGTVGAEERDAFTRVLRGMIAISRLRWPSGLTGRDIDAFARAPLWEAGLDYGHGTGHGVGAYLSVHEGPARIARSGTVALKPGMILSNEPGFYREDRFGIRIENLIVVRPAPEIAGATVKDMLVFETLTWVPIDRRLIRVDMLTNAERDWLDAYHATCRTKLAPHLDGAAAEWLERATAPL